MINKISFPEDRQETTEEITDAELLSYARQITMGMVCNDSLHKCAYALFQNNKTLLQDLFEFEMANESTKCPLSSYLQTKIET